MREQRTELIGCKEDDLFLVNGDNTYHIFTKEQFADVPKALSSVTFLRVKKIKQIKNLAGQQDEMGLLAFNLERSVQMFEALLKASLKYDVPTSEYHTAMENISNFVQTNIIDVTKEKIEELDMLLQSIN